MTPDLNKLIELLGRAVLDVVSAKLQAGEALEDVRLVDTIGQQSVARIAKLLADEEARKQLGG